MDENILGKNIKYLRTMNGETLEELGNVIRASKRLSRDMRVEDVCQILQL